MEITRIEFADFAVVVTTATALLNSISLTAAAATIAGLGQRRLLKTGSSTTEYVPRETGVIVFIAEAWRAMQEGR